MSPSEVVIATISFSASAIFASCLENKRLKECPSSLHSQALIFGDILILTLLSNFLNVLPHPVNLFLSTFNLGQQRSEDLELSVFERSELLLKLFLLELAQSARWVLPVFLFNWLDRAWKKKLSKNIFPTISSSSLTWFNQLTYSPTISRFFFWTLSSIVWCSWKRLLAMSEVSSALSILGFTG